MSSASSFWRANEDSPWPALSKIIPCRSSPRKACPELAEGRESTSVWADMDPRLRGGDDTDDFLLFGRAADPRALRISSDQATRLRLRLGGPQVILWPAKPISWTLSSDQFETIFWPLLQGLGARDPAFGARDWGLGAWVNGIGWLSDRANEPRSAAQRHD